MISDARSSPGATITCGTIISPDPSTRMLEWMEGYNMGLTEEYGDKTSLPGEWKIEVEFKDKTRLKSGAEQHFPKKWKNLKTLIEETTGCSFILR